MQELPENLNFQIKHIGVNCASDAEAMKTALLFQKIFGLPVTDGKDSVFVSSDVELMKVSGKGTHGHIAVGTANIVRALECLQNQGCEFDMDSRKFGADGELTVIYFKEEFSGFAVHLLQV